MEFLGSVIKKCLQTTLVSILKGQSAAGRPLYIEMIRRAAANFRIESTSLT
jgi:hypothetical protein